MMKSSERTHIDTLNELLNRADRTTHDRAVHYMSRFPNMTEYEACQAALAWRDNMNKQRQRRLSHATGAY